jgi:hypothetical protein
MHVQSAAAPAAIEQLKRVTMSDFISILPAATYGAQRRCPNLSTLDS